MDPLILIVIFLSFFICFLVMPFWIRKCREVGLLWSDMNKRGNPKNVASSGGIVVVLAFILGVLLYIAFKTFIIKDGVDISVQIFSLLTVILILGLIGLVDDLLGWAHGGLSARTRVFLGFFVCYSLNSN